jgi:Phosphotransferase enzyme family
MMEQEFFELLTISAEQILTQVLGSPVEIGKVDRLTDPGRRNLLLRCFVGSSDGLPSSFILKKVEAEVYNPDDAESWDTQRFFNDWVGSQFLSGIAGAVNHSPRFYGGDRQLGFILLEDVPHQDSLVESLLGDSRERAEWALLQYATCLGQLHTATMGRAAEFEALYGAIAPGIKLTTIKVDIAKHRVRLEKLGIMTDSSWLQDMEAIAKTLNNPSDFLAYIHTDACPDNVLNNGEVLRLIDFETGRFGHALIDAAYGRMMFPSCWCANRLPHTVVQQMENTYRTILSQRCAIAEDDQIFEAALAHTCGFWLLYTLTRHFEDALAGDLDFGISTIRQRILARLESFIATSQEFDRLPGLRSTSSQLLELLYQRWSEQASLSLYPAFQKSEKVP